MVRGVNYFGLDDWNMLPLELALSTLSLCASAMDRESCVTALATNPRLGELASSPVGRKDTLVRVLAFTDGHQIMLEDDTWEWVQKRLNSHVEWGGSWDNPERVLLPGNREQTGWILGHARDSRVTDVDVNWQLLPEIHALASQTMGRFNRPEDIHLPQSMRSVIAQWTWIEEWARKPFWALHRAQTVANFAARSWAVADWSHLTVSQVQALLWDMEYFRETPPAFFHRHEAMVRGTSECPIPNSLPYHVSGDRMTHQATVVDTHGGKQAMLEQSVSALLSSPLPRTIDNAALNLMLNTESMDRTIPMLAGAQRLARTDHGADWVAWLFTGASKWRALTLLMEDSTDWANDMETRIGAMHPDNIGWF